MFPFLLLILVIFLFPLFSGISLARGLSVLSSSRSILHCFYVKSLLLLKFRKFLTRSSHFSLPGCLWCCQSHPVCFHLRHTFHLRFSIYKTFVSFFLPCLSCTFSCLVWEFLMPCHSFCHLYNCGVCFCELFSFIMAHIFLLLRLPGHFRCEFYILECWGFVFLKYFGTLFSFASK